MITIFAGFFNNLIYLRIIGAEPETTFVGRARAAALPLPGAEPVALPEPEIFEIKPSILDSLI
jgi:hypothetical protein